MIGQLQTAEFSMTETLVSHGKLSLFTLAKTNAVPCVSESEQAAAEMGQGRRTGTAALGPETGVPS